MNIQKRTDLTDVVLFLMGIINFSILLLTGGIPA